jgi:hypothetical protein
LHPPQWALRVVVSVSQPVPKSPSQSARAPVQDVMVHELDWHSVFASARMHESSQLAQSLVVPSSVSQPLLDDSSQLP